MKNIQQIIIACSLLITTGLSALPLQHVATKQHVLPIAKIDNESYLLLCQTTTTDKSIAWHIPTYLAASSNQLIELFVQDTQGLTPIIKAITLRSKCPTFLLYVQYAAGKIIRQQNMARMGHGRDWTWVRTSDLVNTMSALKPNQKAIVRSAQGAWIYLHPDLVALLQDPAIIAAL